LLDAFTASGQLVAFAPFDVNEATLRAACEMLAGEYPSLHLHGVVGDFERHLHTIPAGGHRLVAFLGGTIGNFEPASRAAFLADLAGTLRSGEPLLLGTDLVKDVARLEAAYDDAAVVTAAFNLNVLRVINRELEADFDVDQFEHVARFDPVEEWIEMRLRATQAQRVHVATLGLTLTVDAQEEIRTEISAKFRRARVESELHDAGFDLVRWMTDAAGDFALSLAVRR